MNSDGVAMTDDGKKVLYGEALDEWEATVEELNTKITFVEDANLKLQDKVAELQRQLREAVERNRWYAGQLEQYKRLGRQMSLLDVAQITKSNPLLGQLVQEAKDIVGGVE